MSGYCPTTDKGIDGNNRGSLGITGPTEADQRITDGLLHGVFGGPIEGEVVDHRADHHAAPRELTDVVAHILIIATKAIYPTNDKGVAGPCRTGDDPSGRSTRRV
jgi:hypothetical protein